MYARQRNVYTHALCVRVLCIIYAAQLRGGGANQSKLATHYVGISVLRWTSALNYAYCVSNNC